MQAINILHRNAITSFARCTTGDLTLIRSRGSTQLSRPLWRHGFHSDTQSDVLATLVSRGLIKDVAGDRDALRDRLQRRQVGFYAGIDPTAPSLHLGHLLPLMVLFWLYVHGHHTVSLIGGATAQVGDPSGRLLSRARTDRSVEISNTEALHAQVAALWERAEAYGQRHGYQKRSDWRRTLLNNADWLQQLNIVDFLKQLGSSMRIGTMLTRDTVKNKMEKGDGMSFAEFAYPLLQGWDWWHMFKHHDIQVQIGGSDQYGNIVAGMESVRSCAEHVGDRALAAVDDRGTIKPDSTPMGVTTPLLTTASGEKFGKSAGNAIWLDPSLTSPFDMYGFLLRTSDENVEQYLQLFTFVPLDVIAAIMQRHQQDPKQREAQHLLAYEVSELVHGPMQATSTAERHKSLRELDLSSVINSSKAPATSADTTAGDKQRIKLPASALSGSSFPQLLYAAGLTASKSEGARIVKNGGLYVAQTSGSNASVDDLALRFVQVINQQPSDIPSTRDNSLIILRLGKWKVRVIEFEADPDTVRD